MLPAEAVSMLKWRKVYKNDIQENIPVEISEMWIKWKAKRADNIEVRWIMPGEPGVSTRVNKRKETVYYVIERIKI